MKKRIVIAAVVLLIMSILVIVFVDHSSKIVGYDGLIAKARKEIKLADTSTIEIAIAGKSTISNNTHLFWFITGNEHQMSSCHPIEFIELENNEYEYIHTYNPLPRGKDIYALLWHSGYSFLVNNPNCKTIKICDYRGDTIIPVDEIPFVYYFVGFPGEYAFYDKDGNIIS